MNTTPRTRFYRDKQDGKVLGVCAGIADYTGIDVLWIRLGFIAFTLMMGWPIIAYFALGMIADKKPSALYGDRDEQKFWQGVRQSPTRSAREVRGKLREIDRRLADIETYYVTSNPRLSAEIERLR
ncbi:phage shock protein C (PspC) family protein [Novosphingobium kunmingense]|uniref:Phage shock protein C (PspC) family protein n=1 Tax=Novosphingobium kunmingense TaxID=1211806 RepID=A0A2N0H310_9SPHN|nr:envelope stress response membrane protein PspC [Novosphingobium kunmingense]PKB13321.1 phage shock protein C (PspC) family protein [Novosphingobium kunmingense]